jgi:hypothetical protein
MFTQIWTTPKKSGSKNSKIWVKFAWTENDHEPKKNILTHEINFDLIKESMNPYYEKAINQKEISEPFSQCSRSFKPQKYGIQTNNKPWTNLYELIWIKDLQAK